MPTKVNGRKLDYSVHQQIPLAERVIRRRQYRFDVTLTLRSTVPLDEMFETTHLELHDRLKVMWRLVRVMLEGSIHTTIERVKVFRLKALGEADQVPNVEYR